MLRLKPEKWLNDDIINFYFALLAKRDYDLCLSDGKKKRSHFYNTQFMTQLRNEDEGGNDKFDDDDENYKFGNVKRWTKTIPGGDVFALDKLFIPINITNTHWACVTVFMDEKIIEYYDSIRGRSGLKYTKAVLRYLKDLDQSSQIRQQLSYWEEWELVDVDDSPKQNNSFDCGVFVCMIADCLGLDQPLTFTQEHINHCRQRIALAILNGCVPTLDNPVGGVKDQDEIKKGNKRSLTL